MEPLLTLDEAAQVLHTSRSWVENQIRAGRLRKTKLGKIVRIEPSDLRAFIDEHKKPTVEKTVTTLSIAGDLPSSPAQLKVVDTTER